MDGLLCKLKVYTTPTYLLVHLLLMQDLRQIYHHYLPCHNFSSGVENGISDRPYQSKDLTDTKILAFMDKTYPQRLPWRMRTPTSTISSTIHSTLRKKKISRASLLVDLMLLLETGKSGMSYAGACPPTPYLYCTGNQCLYSTCVT